jgi:hypothetical protein
VFSRLFLDVPRCYQAGLPEPNQGDVFMQIKDPGFFTRGKLVFPPSPDLTVDAIQQELTTGFAQPHSYEVYKTALLGADLIIKRSGWTGMAIKVKHSANETSPVQSLARLHSFASSRWACCPFSCTSPAGKRLSASSRRSSPSSQVQPLITPTVPSCGPPVPGVHGSTTQRAVTWLAWVARHGELPAPLKVTTVNPPPSAPT